MPRLDTPPEAAQTTVRHSSRSRSRRQPSLDNRTSRTLGENRATDPVVPNETTYSSSYKR